MLAATGPAQHHLDGKHNSISDQWYLPGVDAVKEQFCRHSAHSLCGLTHHCEGWSGQSRKFKIIEANKGDFARDFNTEAQQRRENMESCQGI
jgi:hypothetical protein